MSDDFDSKFQQRCKISAFILLKHSLKNAGFDWSAWDEYWTAAAVSPIAGSEHFMLAGEKIGYELRLEVSILEASAIGDNEHDGEIHLSLWVGEGAGYPARPLWRHRVSAFQVKDLLWDPLKLAKDIEKEVGLQTNAYGTWIDAAIWRAIP